MNASDKTDRHLHFLPGKKSELSSPLVPKAAEIFYETRRLLNTFVVFE